MFGVTVPVFGLGIRPRGPSTLPSLPTARIMSGVATTASKSIQPPWILSTSSSPPTTSAPASSASFCFSAPAIASTRLLLPSPCGRTTVPRTIWSACFGIDAEAKRDLDGLVELRELHLLHERNGLFDRVRTIGNLLPGGSEFLACLSHSVLPWC